MHSVNPQADCRRNAVDECRKIGAKRFECGGTPLAYQSGFTDEPWRHNYGSICVRDYDMNLLPPQRRTFLFPSMYNGGCETLFCNNTTDCPGSSRSVTSPQTRQMFNVMFGSFDPYAGVNSVSTSCSGVKCDGPNGPAGWQLADNGRPRWMNSPS